MGSISTIFTGLITAITNGDIDISALLTTLINSSADQQQPGAGGA